jgi:hypothetical protein
MEDKGPPERSDFLLVNSKRKGPHLGSTSKTWPTGVGDLLFVQII